VQRNGRSTVRPRRLRGGGKKGGGAGVSRVAGLGLGFWVPGHRGFPFVGRRRCPGRAGLDKEARRRSRGKLSAGEEGGEGEGADRWGQAEGMTEKGKERLRKERND
jgi:hypothetical protein